jgi:1-acyl-sn-glycerol-3-phosphate acyltransferase
MHSTNAEIVKKKSPLKIISQNATGVLGLSILATDTILLYIPILILSIFKLIIPIKWIRVRLTKLLNFMCEVWFSINDLAMKIIYNMKFDISLPAGLDKKNWYLLLANHQSWIDCMVLLKVFNKKIPFIRIFSKKQMIWLPFLGISAWALDFPFVKRYSKAEIEKNPKLKGKDLEITKKACEKFKSIPVSVINFAEGTRFTLQKKQNTNSPYNNLLKPKAGGTALVLNSMQGKMNTILDITIIYPEGVINMWQFLCGCLKNVKVIVNKISVTDELLGNYADDDNYRLFIQSWLNEIFLNKDRLITEGCMN